MPDAQPEQRLFPEIVWRIIIFGAALGIIIVFATEWNRWEGEAGPQETDDAYLQADLTPISAKVSGYIRSVSVQDFDRVHAGQVLAEIVDDDYRAAVDKATADVAASKAQIEVLNAQLALQRTNVEATHAVVAATQANFDQSQRDLQREHLLLSTGSSSKEATEHITTTHAQLAAQLEQNKAQEAAAEKQLGVLTAQIAQAQAALEAQNANLELAKINLGYTKIVAPQDGEIGQRQIRVGQYLGVGGQVATLAPLPSIWIIANYKETQLTHMVIGDTAKATVDAFPGHTLRGKVIGFSPASGAQFALLPPDNATGNFTKVVQRLAVKISIDDADGLADRLRAGMSVIATVEANDHPPATKVSSSK